MNQLFESIGTRDNESWYTWSHSFRKKLVLIADELSTINTQLIDIFPNESYGTSYINSKDYDLSERLKNVINYMTSSLIKVTPSNGIILFKNLLFDNFSGKSLHVLFSLLSEDMRNKNNISALHSPIVEKKSDTGFPVHADLFRTKSLFNVITETEMNKNGNILLLSIHELEEAMNAVSYLPCEVKEVILSTLKGRAEIDSFDFIYTLMYGNNPWKDDLIDEIEKRQVCISSENGIGYLVIDGIWLHGRDKYLGEIKENRLNRLLFDTENTKNINKVPNMDNDCLVNLNISSRCRIKNKSIDLKSLKSLRKIG